MSALDLMVGLAALAAGPLLVIRARLMQALGPRGRVPTARPPLA